MVRIIYWPDVERDHVKFDSGDVPDLVSRSLDLTDGGGFPRQVPAIIRRAGFTRFVYVSLVMAEAGEPRVVVVTDAPRDWASRYARPGYLDCDPCVESCLRHARPYVWDATNGCGVDGDLFRSEARRHGLASGIALPVRGGPGDDKAMFLFCYSTPQLPTDEELQLAIGRGYILASYFQERLFYKFGLNAYENETRGPRMSGRERQVLELAARGHSSKRIAYELGIAESTANYHVASIKRKLGARTRTHAIAQAVQSGLLR